MQIASGATEADIQAALKLLELRAEASLSSSTRKAWVFPTLSGVSGFGYRVDETAGLVRYYLYDSTYRSFADATTAAAGRSLFGKSGYLGVPTSSPEKSTYKEIVQQYSSVFLAISDATTEGKWLVTAGPRKGQLFWDHTTTQFGPGAAGSGWSKQTDFWHAEWWGSDPDGGTGENYARIYDGESIYDVSHQSMKSVSHHDLLLAEGEIFARLVEVAEPPPNPILRVDFDGSQATAQRPLILTEHHLSVKDIDTLDPSDPTKVDASRIKFRITNIANGTLKRLTGAPSAWVNIVGAQGFSLADVQGGLIAFFPDAGASTLTFDIQAEDDKANLSDSDPYDDEDDADPTSVSVSVVALRTVAAGEEVPINGDVALTPDNDTLDAWLAADDALEIFVFLREGRSGILKPSTGVVQERLSVGTHSVPSNKIVVSWDADNWRLSLAATSRGSAARADFQEVLNALQLQTVHFGQVSHRTILVQPDIAGDVFKKEFYVREVQVSASLPSPILEVAFDRLHVESGQRLVLTEKHISVYDPDTPNALDISFRVSGLTGGTLQSSTSGSWKNIDLTPSTAVSRVHPCRPQSRASRLSGRRRAGLRRGQEDRLSDSGCRRCGWHGEPERLRPSDSGQRPCRCGDSCFHRGKSDCGVPWVDQCGRSPLAERCNTGCLEAKCNDA